MQGIWRGMLQQHNLCIALNMLSAIKSLHKADAQGGAGRSLGVQALLQTQANPDSPQPVHSVSDDSLASRTA